MISSLTYGIFQVSTTLGFLLNNVELLAWAFNIVREKIEFFDIVDENWAFDI